MIAAPANSEPDFYSAMIRSAKIDPRWELTLRIETWPKQKPKFGGGKIFTLRFGASGNFEEIQKLFTNLPADGLHYLQELEPSTGRRRVVEMEFHRTGKRFVRAKSPEMLDYLKSCPPSKTLPRKS